MGGSLARMGFPAPVASATYNAANQLTSWDGVAHTYDANGNLTSDTSRTLTWDSRNRLASLSGPVAGNFSYDAMGRRKSKTVAGTSTGFLYDGLNIVQELNGASPQANLLTGQGIDEVFARTAAGGNENFVTDGLGSTVALTDAAGAVQTSYTYEAYGKAAKSGTATTNSQTYTGREDDGTGLYYYRARYYNPIISRFVSEDPIGLGGGINVYAYVGGNPLSWIDPSGLGALPGDPSGLGPQWSQDPSHRDPNGSRWRDRNGNSLDWHPAQPRKPGWRGRDHWHCNGGDKHLRPGDEAPVDTGDPDPVPPEDKTSFSASDVLLGLGAIAIGIGTVLAPEIFIPATVIGGMVTQ